MRCCRCSEEMLLVEYQQIEIDYCPDCGIWLDAGELELLLEDTGGDPPGPAAKPGADATAASDTDKPVKCPVCRARMNKGRYDDASASVVDTCPRGHGMWLDRGELREIVKTHAGGEAEDGSAVTSFLVNLFAKE